MTLNVGGDSTIGPPTAPAGYDRDQQRSVRGRRRGGTFTGNTVIGSGWAGRRASTAIVVFAAANLTVDNNTITGAGTDIGISVNSSNECHDLQQRGRPHRDSMDITGIGIGSMRRAHSRPVTRLGAFDPGFHECRR